MKECLMKDCCKSFWVEFVGTFMLMFTIGTALLLGKIGIFAAFAIGLVLMVMVYAGGPVSGGHYNPAVSLAAALRGALSWKLLAKYWVAQILGAALAAWIVGLMLDPAMVIVPANFPLAGVLIGEFIFSFALCYVVLMTATLPKAAGNSYFGFAIGGTVMVGAFVVGGISLAAFNPAVVGGLFILGLVPVSMAWVTIGTNLIGGICAALFYKMVSCE